MQACIRTTKTRQRANLYVHKHVDRHCTHTRTHSHTLIEIRNFQYVLLISKRQKSRLCGCQLELNTKCEVGKKATTITVRHVFLSRFFWYCKWELTIVIRYTHAWPSKFCKCSLRNGTLNAANRSWHICNYEILVVCVHSLFVWFAAWFAISTWLIICCWMLSLGSQYNPIMNWQNGFVFLCRFNYYELSDSHSYSR